MSSLCTFIVLIGVSYLRFSLGNIVQCCGAYAGVALYCQGTSLCRITPLMHRKWDGFYTSARVCLWIYQAVCVYFVPLLSCSVGFLDIQHSGWRLGHCFEEALNNLKSKTNVYNSNSKWFRFHGQK